VNPHPLNRLLWWCNLILRLASWIVPRRQRLEWRQEWEAEVWHWSHFLIESGRLSPRTEQELVWHCWGAFADALWHRFNRVVVLRYVAETPRTPQFCLFACLALLAVLLFGRPAAFFFDTIAPAPYANRDCLLTVLLSDKTYWLQPEVLRDLAARWPAQTQAIDSSAVYAWRPSMVRGPGGTESLLSARVTAGIFGLLGVRPSLGRVFQEADSSQCENCVVLSNMLWRSQFHRDEHVIGRSLILNDRNVKIIGVMPLEFRFPVRDIAVYSSFESNPHPMLPRFEWPGVLLRVAARVEMGTAKRELEDFINRTDSLPADTQLRIWSLKDIEKQSLESWASMVLLALALLLAFKSGQFARLHTTGPHADMKADFRWYLFFSVKAVLLLVASLIASVELAHLVLTRSNSTNAYSLASAAAVWFFLFGAHITLTWAIRDQLGRCRVCLRGLAVRVNLGSAGRILIDLTGVELVCGEGHGALHIPVMESGCVDSERWTYLDESWQVLLGCRETRIQVF
jgi:hypothetical protein